MRCSAFRRNVGEGLALSGVSFEATTICASLLAIPLGELSAKLTERVGRVVVDPLRPSLRSDTSPKGGGKGACHFAEGACKIGRCVLPGGQRRPPLQGVLRCRRWFVQFCNCTLPGRCRHRPLQTLCEVAICCAELLVRSARAGQALPLRYGETMYRFTNNSQCKVLTLAGVGGTLRLALGDDEC